MNTADIVATWTPEHGWDPPRSAPPQAIERKTFSPRTARLRHCLELIFIEARDGQQARDASPAERAWLASDYSMAVELIDALDREEDEDG
jgi:hypothetical protein